jgi:hypothetical protein
VAGHGGGLGQVLELAPHRLDGDSADPGSQHGFAEDVHDLPAALVQDRLPAHLRRDKRPDGLWRDAVLSEELLAVRHLAHERCGLEEAGYEGGLVFGEQLGARGLQGPQLVLECCRAARPGDPVFPYPVFRCRLAAQSEQRPGLGADRRSPRPGFLFGRKLQAVLDPGDLRLPPAGPERLGELESGDARLLAQRAKSCPESAKRPGSGRFSQCLVSRSGQDARRAVIPR